MARYTIPDWAEVDPADRPTLSRHMQVYAAMVDSIDQSLGRILDTIDSYGPVRGGARPRVRRRGRRRGGPAGQTEHPRTTRPRRDR